MKIIDYIKDKIIIISLYILIIINLLIFFYLFKINLFITFLTIFSIIILLFSTIIIDYVKKNNYYQELINNILLLDKKYYISEIIKKPDFIEGKILYDILYDIDKSMIENIKEKEISIIEFKEYLELWIHEIKIPLSSLMLINHNNQKNLKEIRKLENYLEQILYYVRSENIDKDFLIKEYNLKKIINEIALKNKDDLLDNKIEFIANNLDYNILTDSKWLMFILNQIINNSIKYKNNNNSIIKIYSSINNNNIKLSIYDNGIGINEKDIKRVFDKSFTGENGRIYSKSTGMGLYIVKKLCEKLGHKIDIESKLNEYTIINIYFYKDDFYLKK